MAWAMTAVAAGSALIGSSASRSAASQQSDAAQRATEQQQVIYDQQRADNMPFYRTGVAANNQLSRLMGLNGGTGELTKSFDGSRLADDAGYQFRLGEGMKGVESGAAARGGLLSGGAMKAMQKYGQGFASDEYSKAYDRFNNDQTTKFNRFAALGGAGQTAAGAMTSAAGAFGSMRNSNTLAAGDAGAAGAMGAANAWGSAINNGVSSYQNNQLMNMIGKR